jgi:Domain of unknown function (DUF4301)
VHTTTFEEQDLEALARRGISVDEAAAQIDRIRRGSGHLDLIRAATVGDGIESCDGREAALDAAAADAVAAGRCSAFVPASGAATRMFQDLIAALDQGIEIETPSTRALLEDLPRFAFHEALSAALERRGLSLAVLQWQGKTRPILEALLDESGLGYAEAPKGLVLFHRAPEGPRTALDEHLVDGAAALADDSRVARLHFTLAPEHEARAMADVRGRAEALEARGGSRFEIGWSTQGPDSQCLAATPEGGPFRDENGLVFRPGGHGALLPNLAASGGDLVFIRNVDNVPVDKGPVHRWMRRLLGWTASLEREVHALLDRLDDASDAAATDDARRFVATVFRRTVPTAAEENPRAIARRLLDRPIRVCGMVPNLGEPGGGPYWVRGTDGEVSLQIVEHAQVAPEQRGMLERASHFNPAFLACALRDRAGRPRDLRPFVDPDAVIVTRKSSGDRELLALERPGLWNGGMAYWNSVFVEIPGATFAPVKTVFDLLRPEHQPKA